MLKRPVVAVIYADHCANLLKMSSRKWSTKFQVLFDVRNKSILCPANLHRRWMPVDAARARAAIRVSYIPSELK